MRTVGRRCVLWFDLVYHLLLRALILTPCLVHEQECTLRGHSGSVTRVQFSDDGLQVISGSDDGTVLVSPILRANPASQSCVPILRAESHDQLRGPC